jgi:hypothetical protein
MKFDLSRSGFGGVFWKRVSAVQHEGRVTDRPGQLALAADLAQYVLQEGIQLGQKPSFSVCHLQLKPGVFLGFSFRYFDTDFLTQGIEITKQTVVGVTGKMPAQKF